ncbi:hypothetical protein FDP41_011386 [Naegleria fowleri]|uniref:Uncharacterized protein n=1 Tax=Naegleria fowleri TaxID=5763 RepID=A0A6A5C3X9_NAEFO|nr:uncharacterized protein FDP41_011386 [Naegleria fowleri]KAF0982456.1 hypothetical protein FDP41_011386 [Naegleria fowleri]CAG4717879.1 unnamed protein product [Naegleria fowleri]
MNNRTSLRVEGHQPSERFHSSTSESSSGHNDASVLPASPEKLLKQTRRGDKPSGPDDTSILLELERSIYEARLNSPKVFNFTVFNIVLGAAYMGGVLRKRRVPPQHAKATILTLTTSFLGVFCYLRNLSSNFAKVALDPRTDHLTSDGIQRWEKAKKKLLEKEEE